MNIFALVVLVALAMALGTATARLLIALREREPWAAGLAFVETVLYLTALMILHLAFFREEFPV